MDGQAASNDHTGRAKRVAIIGAGPAGLATAYHLTESQRRGDLPESLQITIYERSWRPGGKGTTGRDPEHGWSIVEHGIHLFSGFYRNAFDMVRTAYTDLCGEAAGLAHLRHEFVGNSVTLLRGTEDGAPRRWVAPLPRTNGEPWDDEFDLSFDVSVLAEKAATFMIDALHTCRILDEPIDVDLTTGGLGDTGDSQPGLRHLLRRVRAATCAADDDFRPLLWGAELLGTMVAGVIADDLVERGVEAIGHIDHLTWLARHGCSAAALASPMAEAIPAICFQFPGGDSRQPALMSAAAFVATATRQLMAPGDFAYFFRRGTGETVVLPIVKLLIERGVQFRWCHRLAEVSIDADSASLRALRFQTLVDSPSEMTLVDVPGLEPATGHHCACGIGQAWSIHPPTTSNPEDPTTTWDGPPVALTVGVEVDVVVLAIPPPAFSGACQGTPLDRLVDLLPSTATMSAQLWLDAPITRLGLPDLGGDRLAGSDWEDPLNGWADFTDLIDVERWGDHPPEGLLYFCGTVVTPLSRADAEATADRELARLVDHVSALLHGGRPQPLSGHVRHSVIRVNWQGSDRYVMSPPSATQERPRAWESGLGNLVLAGDWTRNGFDVSSFEASVMSGALAAHALSAEPPLDTIVGYRLLREPGGRDVPPADWVYPLLPPTTPDSASVSEDASSAT